MSQSGLYGVNGLPGGSGPDFGVQDIAPPTDRSELAKTRGKWKVAAEKAKPLPYMHPETIKELISVLSTPEILQVSCKTPPSPFISPLPLPISFSAAAAVWVLMWVLMLARVWMSTYTHKETHRCTHHTKHAHNVSPPPPRLPDLYDPPRLMAVW
jgi:hypothetical protein